MSKKIAVIVRDRQSEALRMSAGITFMDDTIELFFIDQRLQASEDVETNLEIATEMEITLYTNVRENTGMNFLETAELERKLLEYDHIVAY
jgi:hypothetical protein